jgi:CTP:molybdopterin cytidylyltransferase MocA
MLNTAGLILAAGLSSRMGQTKALLPFGEEALLERQIKCFLSAGVEGIFIVTGHNAKNVEEAVKAYPVKTVYNSEYKQGMFTSVKAGLSAVKQGGAGAVFLLPVDCALITPQILETMITRFNKGRAMIVYPCHKGLRGHPPLFSAQLIDKILASIGEGGLKEALSAHDEEAANVEAGSCCLTDIDTWEDYMKALKQINR